MCVTCSSYSFSLTRSWCWVFNIMSFRSFVLCLTMRLAWLFFHFFFILFFSESVTHERFSFFCVFIQYLFPCFHPSSPLTLNIVSVLAWHASTHSSFRVNLLPKKGILLFLSTIQNIWASACYVHIMVLGGNLEAAAGISPNCNYCLSLSFVGCSRQTGSKSLLSLIPSK